VAHGEKWAAIPSARDGFLGAVGSGRKGIYRCLSLIAGPARHRVVRSYGRALGARAHTASTAAPEQRDGVDFG